MRKPYAGPRSSGVSPNLHVRCEDGGGVTATSTLPFLNSHLGFEMYYNWIDIRNLLKNLVNLERIHAQKTTGGKTGH